MSSISLPVRPVIIVTDTDGHGVSLGAALTRALTDIGIKKEDIAILSHFNPRGVTTSARGDLVGFINALADAVEASDVKPRIYFLDVPVPEQAPEDYFDALARLAKAAHSINYIDVISHGKNSMLPRAMAVRGVRNVHAKLKLSVAETYIEPMLIAPSNRIFDLAILGTTLDMDIKSLPLLNEIKQVVEAAEETEIQPVTVESIRRHMHEFVLIDNYLKFGRNLPSVPDDYALWGNMAQKVAIFAETPMKEIIERANAENPGIPTVEEIKNSSKIVNFIAVVALEAPKGHAFNFAKLAQAAFNVPIVMSIGEGFQPDKKVIVIAPNVFDPEYDLAADVITKSAQPLFEKYVKNGWSDPQTDFPRGTGAIAVGVKSEHLEDAVKEAVNFINEKYARSGSTRALQKRIEQKLMMIVPSHTLASQLAWIITDALREARGVEI